MLNPSQDIGMAIDDFREELIDVFTMNNLMLMHSFGRVNDSFELSFRDEEIKLDIFFFYREEDHAWNGGTRFESLHFNADNLTFLISQYLYWLQVQVCISPFLSLLDRFLGSQDADSVPLDTSLH